MRQKIYTLAIICITMFFGNSNAQVISMPKTAVSFPKGVIPADSGKIEFWAKLEGFSGFIPWGGTMPYFFMIMDGVTSYAMGFNGNDGVGNGGLVGSAGNYSVGTGPWEDNWTYEMIFGEGKVNKWHHYTFIWNRNGIPGMNEKRVAIYIDNELNSTSQNQGTGNYDTITSCARFTLFAMSNPANLEGKVIMDELKIYDGNNKLILWNTLGSPAEISNSKIGLNGSFDGFGNPTFVKGISGYAISATPLLPHGEANCNDPVAGKCCIYVTDKLYSCTPGVTIDQCAWLFSKSAQASDLLFSENEDCETACPEEPPVTILNLNSLNGNYDDVSKSIVIQWTIPEEKNNLRFFIERSQDALRFKKIALINPNNRSGNGTYSFVDINPMPVNYYRLVEVSGHGTIRKSQAVAVICNEKDKVLLYPNPAKDKVRLLIQNMQLSSTRVSVYNSMGREVINKLLLNGDHELNVSGLNPGIYNIRVMNNGKVYTQRFIKN